MHSLDSTTSTVTAININTVCLKHRALPFCPFPLSFLCPYLPQLRAAAGEGGAGSTERKRTVAEEEASGGGKRLRSDLDIDALLGETSHRESEAQRVSAELAEILNTPSAKVPTHPEAYG